MDGLVNDTSCMSGSLSSGRCLTDCLRFRRVAIRSMAKRRRARAVLSTEAAPTAVEVQGKPQGIKERLQKARVITAIKTPFKENGRIDLKAYDRMAELQIENGVDGLIVGGTTGEGHLMSWDEHVMLIAHTAVHFKEKLFVIGNTGSNATREAIHATEQGFAVGMHAALQINPYYGKTSMRGLKRHFRAVLREGPAIIYNVPGRTAQDIPDEVILELKDEENFVGVKECTGNARIKNYTSAGVTCWSGNDDEAFEARHRAGAAGAISVASNVFPGLYARMMKEDDPSLAAKVAELTDWLFCEPNPIPLNTALAMCGLVKPVFRAPYVPLEAAQRRRGFELLQALLPDLPGVDKVTDLHEYEFHIVDNY